MNLSDFYMFEVDCKFLLDNIGEISKGKLALANFRKLLYKNTSFVFFNIISKKTRESYDIMLKSETKTYLIEYNFSNKTLRIKGERTHASS